MSRNSNSMSGSNTIPLGGGGGGGRFASGGGGGGGGSLLNPSYLNQGSVVPLGSNQGERKRPAERESRFDKKESREERSESSVEEGQNWPVLITFLLQEEEEKVSVD